MYTLTDTMSEHDDFNVSHILKILTFTTGYYFNGCPCFLCNGSNFFFCFRLTLEITGLYLKDSIHIFKCMSKITTEHFLRTAQGRAS